MALGQKAYASSLGADYLCEIAIEYYEKGNFAEALHEFKKALIVDPHNETALEYIAAIQRCSSTHATSSSTAYPKKQYVSRATTHETTPEIDYEPSYTAPATRRQVAYEPSYTAGAAAAAPAAGYQPREEEAFAGRATEQAQPAIKLSGEVQLAAAATSGEAIWNRANKNLSELNWRMLSNSAYDNRFNTYDPYIFDRLRLNLDSTSEFGFKFHTNVTLDPWSYTGTSKKFTVVGSTGDSAEIELKYWGNTNRIVNQTVHTTQNGDSFNIPELEVHDGKVRATTITSTWGNTFTIPETEIERTFMPLRELWVEYATENFNLRVFPLAYQSQALSTDDPLGLSNHRDWWQVSPWVSQWTHGNYNSGTPNHDFTRGYWDDSLASLAQDSDSTVLTLLRGFSATLKPTDTSSIAWTVASPKNPWQEYSEVDNITSAARAKTKITDNLGVGATYTYRMGFNPDRNDETDARNHTAGVDAKYEFMDGLMASAEVAHAQNTFDITSNQFKTKERGNAYYFSLVGRFPMDSIIDLEYGYNQIKPEKGDDFLAKFRFYGAHMDEGFSPGVASYRQTRDDAFWARHLHFRKPFPYTYRGLSEPTLSWDSIAPFAIGDGIDAGRDAAGFRLEANWVDRLENLFDARNVHSVNGKYIESVGRDEVTWHITDRLTSKLLGIYQDMPKSKGGIDPFLYDSVSGRPLNDWSSDPIDDGKDIDLKTGSVGLEYAWTDWLTTHGIWEHTNDYTMAYENFPRAVFNSSQPSYLYNAYGTWFRDENPFVYDQQLFPQPPYPFYDIFRVGVDLNPTDRLNIYLDYTRNEFESAGQLDGNMNHAGIEITYQINKKWGMNTKYVYSLWKDVQRLQDGYTDLRDHHNFFAELYYLPTENSKLILQYGISGKQLFWSQSEDPYGGSQDVIDTQHIVRLFYRNKF